MAYKNEMEKLIFSESTARIFQAASVICFIGSILYIASFLVKLQEYEINITYFRALLDTSEVPADLKTYLPLFSSFLSKLGAKQFSYQVIIIINLDDALLEEEGGGGAQEYHFHGVHGF